MQMNNFEVDTQRSLPQSGSSGRPQRDGRSSGGSQSNSQPSPGTSKPPRR